MKKTYLFLLFLVCSSLLLLGRVYASPNNSKPTEAKNVDLELTSLTLPWYLQVNTDGTVSGTVTNMGSTTVTNFDISYQVNGGTIVEYSITGVSITASKTHTFIASVPFQVSTLGVATIEVTITKVNGAPDVNGANNIISTQIFVVETESEFVNRYTLLEVLTSSTCPPCYNENIKLMTLLSTYTSPYTLIKYQMSWPGTGDPYYTAEGNVRRSLYAVNSVPELFVDGVKTSISAANLKAASYIPSFVGISGNYKVEGKTITAALDIKPDFDYAESNNLKLFVAIIEKLTTKNVKSNGETEFHNVMKKMLPDANGISLGALTAGTTITKDFVYEFQGEYRLPNNALDPINHSIEHSVEDFSNLMVICWIQSIPGDKKVTNSLFLRKEGNFYVTYKPNSNGGVVTAKIDGTTHLPFGGQVEPNKNVVFRATTKANYKFMGWKYNGEMLGNTSTEITQPITEDLNMVAVFEPLVAISTFFELQVNVFPNPAKDNITIEGNYLNATITDITGKIVIAAKEQSNIDVSGLSNGIYVIKLANENAIKIQKLVVNK